VEFELFTNITPQKITLQLLYANREGKKINELGILDKVILINVTLPP
jgi:hypothetical protein